MVRKTLRNGADEEEGQIPLRLRDGVPQARLGDPAFAYDEEKALFRWTNGCFAFSREHADWTLSRRRGLQADHCAG
jgi:hypothetical protein